LIQGSYGGVSLNATKMGGPWTNANPDRPKTTCPFIIWADLEFIVGEESWAEKFSMDALTLNDVSPFKRPAPSDVWRPASTHSPYQADPSVSPRCNAWILSWMGRPVLLYVRPRKPVRSRRIPIKPRRRPSSRRRESRTGTSRMSWWARVLEGGPGLRGRYPQTAIRSSKLGEQWATNWTEGPTSASSSTRPGRLEARVGPETAGEKNI